MSKLAEYKFYLDLLQKFQQLLTEVPIFQFQIIEKLIKEIAGYQLQEELHSILIQSLNGLKKSQHLIRILFVADMMFKYRAFRKVLLDKIMEYYCEVFVDLYENKFYGMVECAKELRKFWFNRLQHYQYVKIKEILFLKYYIDIDYLRSQNCIENLKIFYKEILKMKHEEIIKQLPQLDPSNHIYLHYHLQKIDQYQSFIELNHSSRNHTINYQEINNHFYRLAYNIKNPQALDSNSYINSQDNNLRLIQYKKFIQDQGPKKRRRISEFQYSPEQMFSAIQVTEKEEVIDTRQLRHIFKIAKGQPETEIQEKKEEQSEESVKKQNTQDGHENIQELVMEMRKNLEALNNFPCKQCGMRLMTKQIYQNHQNEHFQLKMNEYEDKQRKKKRHPTRQDFCDAKKWIKSESQQPSLVILKERHEFQSKDYCFCFICQDQFQLLFTDNNWMLKDAQRVTWNSQTKVIHDYCKFLFNQPRTIKHSTQQYNK